MGAPSDSLGALLGNKNPQELLEELFQTIKSLSSLGWKEARPWHDFFASFKPPEANYAAVTQRVSTNILHYRSNYLIISAVVMLIRIVFSPMLLVSLSLAIALCYYVFVVHDRPFVFGDVRIEGTTKAVVCGVSLFIFLAISGALENIIWGLLVVVTICGLHAIMRPRSISSRANFVYEDTKLSTGSWLGSGDTGRSSFADDPENPAGSSSDGDSSSAPYSSDVAAVRKRGAMAKPTSAAQVGGSSTKYD